MKIIAALAMTLTLVGCDQVSPEYAARFEAASLQYSRHVEALPIKPPSSNVTVREIAEIFVKGCLPNFDDVDATIADLKRAGLTTEEKLGWAFSENQLHYYSKGTILASMGFSRNGEREYGNVCEVNGVVLDPQSDPYAALRAFAGDLKFDARGNTLVTRDKKALRIHVRAPQLSAEVPELDNAGPIEDPDLTNPSYWKGAYRDWGPVSFSVDLAPK